MFSLSVIRYPIRAGWTHGQSRNRQITNNSQTIKMKCLSLAGSELDSSGRESSTLPLYYSCLQGRGLQTRASGVRAYNHSKNIQWSPTLTHESEHMSRIVSKLERMKRPRERGEEKTARMASDPKRCWSGSIRGEDVADPGPGG